MKKVLILYILVFVGLTTQATVLTVTHVGNSGNGSLRGNITAANDGDTIRFNPSLIALGSIHLTVSTPLIFSKSLTIVGLYNSTDSLYLSGGGSSTVFRVSNTSKLVLDSLVIHNGYSSNGGGGAIQFRSSDSLIVKNSVIRNNIATIGGGIYAYEGNGISSNKSISIQIIDSKIINNTATNGSGGGIYSKGNCCNSSDSANIEMYVSIQGSLIKGNSASMNGGGVYCSAPKNSYSTPSGFATVILKNSEVSMNSSNTGGGVFCSAESYFSKAKSYVRVINSNIYKNISQYHGGGIYSFAEIGSSDTGFSKVEIINSTIDSNQTVYEGGAIYSYVHQSGGSKSEVRAQNSNFRGNSTTQNLGGPSGGAGLFSKAYSSFVSVDSCEIIGNNTVGRGGGIYSHGYNSEVNIGNSTIKDNQSLDDGGGVFSCGEKSSSLKVDDSIIKGNSGNSGGGLFSSKHYSSSVSGSSVIDIYNCEIDSNSALYKGGGVFSQCIYCMKSEINIERSTVSNNASQNNGAGLHSNHRGDSSIFNMAYCSVFGNRSTAGSGGGVYQASEKSYSNSICKSKITFSSFYDNYSAEKGGAIYTGVPTFYSSNSYRTKVLFNMSVSTVKSNRAGLKGGGVFTNSTVLSEVDIEKCSVVFNTAGDYGGNIYSGFPAITTSNSIWVTNDSINMYNYSTPTFTSGGYNIFSDTNVSDTVYSDQIGIDSLDINLDSLNYYGGLTKTLIPKYPSPALSWGNPVDFSSAQNRMVRGIREVGAGESCIDVQRDSIYACTSFTWINGHTYYSSNYTDTVTYINSEGCDSIIELKLTIGYYSLIDTIGSCDSVTWRNGITYGSSNNTARDTLINPNGCDTIVFLDLTIFDSNIYVDNIVACDSLTWINGITYYSNNSSAKDTLVSVGGCDSVVGLNLVINNSSNVIDTIVTCDSLTWINGVTYFSSNSTARDTLITLLGCDSIVSLDLTILETTNVIDTIVTCDSLTWINGITYYNSINGVKDTLINNAGCDSIVTLDLIIKNSTSFTDVITACNSYTWIDGVTYFSSNSTASYTLTNFVGCDSIVTLDLTIENSPSRIDNQVACDSLTWINGVTYYYSNNTDSYVVSTGALCDSIIYLDLIVYHVNLTVIKEPTKIIAQASNATFKWIDCLTGQYIPNETNAIFVVNDSGEYAVEVTQNGCVDTSNCYTFTLVGVLENDEGNVIIYPNPVSNELHIESTKGKVQNVKVLDSSGRLVLMVYSDFETVDVSSLAKGWYHVEVTSIDGVVVKKFIKQ